MDFLEEGARDPSRSDPSAATEGSTVPCTWARLRSGKPVRPDPIRPMHITELSAESGPLAVERMEIPPDALVVLVGASGCGKSTFARQHFTDTQVVSSDECRRLVSDDAGNQAATRAAFAVFYTLVRGRLSHGRLTVADATNLTPRSREKLRQAADSRRRPRIAIAVDVPLEVCLARQTTRARQVRREVVERGHAEFQQALRDLPHEGFAHVYVVRGGGGRGTCSGEH